MSQQEAMVLGLIVTAVKSYWPVLALLGVGAVLITKAAFSNAHYKGL